MKTVLRFITKTKPCLRFW